MFEPKTKEYRRLTHRTYCAVSDQEIIREKEKNIPGWEDTTYKILKIERVLDEASSIYKEIYEDEQ